MSNVREFLQRLPVILTDRAGGALFRLVVNNEGAAPATGLLLELAAVGGLLFRREDDEEEMELQLARQEETAVDGPSGDLDEGLLTGHRISAPLPPPRGYPSELRTVGDHLRKRRLDLGLRQRDAAEKLGVHQGDLRTASTANTPTPTPNPALPGSKGSSPPGSGTSMRPRRPSSPSAGTSSRRANGYDAAMASLDLALLYFKAGRTADLRELAEELQPVFEDENLHSEARAALLLFQEAVREERATARLVKELSAYFRKARTDPTLRFRGRVGVGSD